ncbi:MAG: hypothetical protein KKB50_11870 [Planctomycetes bacterium]|nr:hypothetical protein [Planctomycetota bacterium]
MFAASSLRTTLSAAIFVAVAFWTVPALGGLDDPPDWWGRQNDWPHTESREYGFEDDAWPPQADNPGDQHEGAEPTWTGQGRVNGGVLEITGTLTIRVNNVRYQPNEKILWIQYDYDGYGAAWKPGALELPPNTKAKKQLDDKDTFHHGNWHRRTIRYVITPQPEWEDLKFEVLSGTLRIDNLKIGSHCQHSYGCYGGTDSYFFDVPVWPPESGYEDLPDGYGPTQWDRYGVNPPEWLPAVTDHAGVMGLPGGGMPTDGVLAARLDGIEAPDGVQQVCCQFDFYMAEGGLIGWEEEASPGAMIENRQENITELHEGWFRLAITFDVTPPPDWVDFRWYVFTEPSAGPVAIDNVAMSFAFAEPEGPEQGGPAGFVEPLSVAPLAPLVRWSENFDSYLLGSGLHGQGGWKGWDNDPTFDAVVTDAQARSVPHAADIVGAADLVHEFSGADSGRWQFTTWQYIPGDFSSNGTGDFAGTYIVMMNTYVDGGPHEEQDWSIQMNFDSNDGMLKVYYGNGLNTVDVPYIPDEWVKVQITVDLDEDWTRIYYDDIGFGEYSWTGGVLGDGAGAADIAALDLYANGSTSVYYDSLALKPGAGR